MKLSARTFGLLLIVSVAVCSCKPKQKCAAYSDIPELALDNNVGLTVETE